MARLKAMQVDDLVEFIDKEITAIQLKAFDLGYKQGYAVGLDERQSNIENEYEAYSVGWEDGYDQLVSEIDTDTSVKEFDIRHLED